MAQARVVRWLHLSDFHFRISFQWSQDVVLRTLLEDIGHRHGGTHAADLLFITGDLAFSGRPEEYVLAKDFIVQLQTVVGLGPDSIFIVPGNHDINRDEEEDAFRGLRASLADQLQVDRFFASAGRRRTVFRRQQAFRAFANDVAPPDGAGYTADSFAHHKRTTVGPIKIDVLLLDSAWLAEGGSSDSASLLVGEPQVIETARSCDTRSLTFALMHHPFGFLREFEQPAIENLLLKDVDVLLRGHVHAPDFRWVGTLSDRLPLFTCGACFETRLSQNSYSYSRLDLASGRGETIVYRYSHPGKRWEATEPQHWTLMSAERLPVPLATALKLSSAGGGRFPNYIAALLAGYQTEVPRRFGSAVTIASFTADFPNEANVISPLVLRVRALVHWQDAWDQTAWQAEMSEALRELAISFREAAESPGIADFLSEREELGRTMIETITVPQAEPSRLIEHLRSLANRGDWDGLQVMTGRYQAQGVFTSSEAREVKRITAYALLEQGDAHGALRELEAALASDPDVTDLHLAAACAYAQREYGAAREFIYSALDQGISREVVRSLALAVAGQTGDRLLVERVTS